MKRIIFLWFVIFSFAFVNSSFTNADDSNNNTQVAADKDPAGNSGDYRTVAKEPDGTTVTIESGRDRNTVVTRENPNSKPLVPVKVVGGAEPHNQTVEDNTSKGANITKYKEPIQ